jgi:hypothetical protein
MNGITITALLVVFSTGKKQRCSRYLKAFGNSWLRIFL